MRSLLKTTQRWNSIYSDRGQKGTWILAIEAVVPLIERHCLVDNVYVVWPAFCSFLNLAWRRREMLADGIFEGNCFRWWRTAVMAELRPGSTEIGSFVPSFANSTLAPEYNRPGSRSSHEERLSFVGFFLALDFLAIKTKWQEER